MIKKQGFTLMEMLLTLAVISIVLAILGKVVNASFSKDVFYTSLISNYKSVEQVTQLIKQQNRGTLVGLFTDNNSMLNTYCNQMQCVKTCPPNQNANQCFADTQNAWSSLNYTPGWEDRSSYARAVLINGASISFNLKSGACSDSMYTINSTGAACAYIYIDVNGLNPPNVEGRDIFEFYLTQAGMMPLGTVNSTSYLGGNNWTSSTSNCNPGSSNANNGCACASRLIEEGVMKY